MTIFIDHVETVEKVTTLKLDEAKLIEEMESKWIQSLYIEPKGFFKIHGEQVVDWHGDLRVINKKHFRLLKLEEYKVYQAFQTLKEHYSG